MDGNVPFDLKVQSHAPVTDFEHRDLEKALDAVAASDDH
jgi:hypothetical protein